MFIILLYIVLFSSAGWIFFFLQGPPYVQTDEKSQLEIIRFVKKYKGSNIVDLGSGDAKIVIALSRLGYKVDGVEISPQLVLQSKSLIRKYHLIDKASIKWSSFWNYNVSNYDVVVVYGFKSIMPRLERKLMKELKPNSFVISNIYTFPNLQEIDAKERIHVYKI